MVDYLSEKEQIEEIKNWWRENGRFVLTGIVLGAAILFSWQAWQNYRTTREALASASYNSLFAAVQAGDLELAAQLGGELQAEYQDTPYAAQSGLALAKAYVEANQAEKAVGELQRVVDSSDDEVLVHVARLRLAGLLLSLGQHDEALATLAVADTGSFAARYHALRGDIRYVLGEHDSAREQYRLALADRTPGVIDRNVVQMKLDNLGGDIDTAEAEAATAADAEAVPQ